MNWWHIEGNVTSIELVLPSGAVSTKRVFGIALQTVDGYSSGIVWRTCTYRLTSSVYSSFVLLLMMTMMMMIR